MECANSTDPPVNSHGPAEEDRFLSDTVRRETPRLRNFIRKRVLNSSDAEDVLQDVFFEFIQAYQLMKPAEQMTAWLFRVARNRVTDLFRRRSEQSLSEPAKEDEADFILEDLLPSPEAGPDAVYARKLMYEAVDDAIEELPEEQRAVFIAHEFEGHSFREMAEETGLSINTLLARKRYAVLHLRSRLRELQREYGREAGGR